MKKILFLFGSLALMAAMALAVAPQWRAATTAELHKVLPGRAQVGKEHIELEWRAATGVTDGSGHFIAGAPLITAGYAAHAKYSRFFLTQAPIEIGGKRIDPGSYVLGLGHHGNGTLEIAIFTAAGEQPVVRVNAPMAKGKHSVQSFQIGPPMEGKGNIQVGRFLVPYQLAH